MYGWGGRRRHINTTQRDEGQGHMTGIRRCATVALLVACVVVGCVVGGHSAGSTPDGSRLRIGMSYGNSLLAASDGDLAQTLDDAVTLGAHWIRFDMSWGDVQPTAGDQYAWAGFDRLVAEGTRRGLKPIPILGYTPAWARPAGCVSDKCAPADPGQFARFAGAAAQRFAKVGVDTWEIWNEPNSAGFWQPAVDPDAYSRMLKLATQAIRSSDAKATILLGGLATMNSADGNLSIGDFLLRPAQSPLRFVDGISIHPYTYPWRASQQGPWTTPWLPTLSGMPYLHSVLAQAGAARMPIWITEYGAPTDGVRDPASGTADVVSPESDHVTEAAQAAIAADAIATADSDPQITTLCWYTYRDRYTGASDPEDHYGLKRADGSRKPSFDAFAAAVGRLSH
jgi:hypothetical protein